MFDGIGKCWACLKISRFVRHNDGVVQKMVGSFEIYGLLFYKKVGSFPGMVAAGFMDRSVRFINWSLRLKNGGFVGRSARIRGKQCADSMCESTITMAD